MIFFRNSGLSRSLLIVAATLLVVAIFLPFAHNGFLYDDYLIVLGQPVPQSLEEMARVFDRPFYETLSYYRPLASLAYLLQRGLLGDDPVSFHVVNAVLAGLVCCMAYRFLRLERLRIEAGPALLAAVLFVLHPVASSCVLPISGRDTLLAAFWILAGMYGWCRGGTGGNTVAVLALLAALLSKEMAVILPALLVLADVSGLAAGTPGKNPRAWITRYLPPAVVFLAYAAARHLLFAEASHPPGQVSSVILAYVYAVQVLVVPFVQLLYEPAVETWLVWWRLGVAAVVLLFLGVVTARVEKSTRVRVGFWVAWFLITLLPTANLVWQETRFAERYVFLPGFALFGIIATLASTAWSRQRARWAGLIVGLTMIAIFAGFVGSRGPYWKEERFYSQWLLHAPENVTARYNYANVLEQAGRPSVARLQYERVLELDPEHDQASNNLGKVMIALGDIDDALRRFEAAVGIDPRNEEAQSNLGGALAILGRFSEAERRFRKAIEIRPDYAMAHENLGHVLLKLGRSEEGIAALREARRLDPDQFSASGELEGFRPDRPVRP